MNHWIPCGKWWLYTTTQSPVISLPLSRTFGESPFFGLLTENTLQQMECTLQGCAPSIRGLARRHYFFALLQRKILNMRDAIMGGAIVRHCRIVF